MEDAKKITVYLQNETVEKIKKIVMYENLRNEMFPLSNRPTDFEISDFITGCVNEQLYQIDKFYDLAAFGELGKSGKLKNRFKETLNKKGMLQKDLAKMTKIDDGNISIILSNRSQPSMDFFFRIWIALDCLPLYEVFYREKE